jgi:hypothetical protein
MGSRGQSRSFSKAMRERLVGATVVITLPCLAVASPGPVSQDVPVPGGVTALARALEVEIPDRARCITDVVRLVYMDAKPRRDQKDSNAHRFLTYLRAQLPQTSPLTSDYVPMPLTAAVWSQAVFRRTIASNELFVEVMSDPAAALVAHGLAGLDDETLGFLADHPALVTWLYEQGAPVFATLTSHLHIRDGRVVPPGGPAAASLWEAVLNASAAQPEAFVCQLIGRSEGRLAYLYDVIGHLDSPRAAFALGSWIQDRAVRVERFRALVAVAISAHPEWDVTAYPFTRPTHDLTSMFSRVQVDSTGAPRFPGSRSFWTHAFEASGQSPNDAGTHERLDNSPAIDAGWLAEVLVLGRLQRRIDRLDQFAFGQRAFATADPATLPDALVSVAAFPAYRMLMLTLERIGVVRPAVYAALARHAHALSLLSVARGPAALGQFQGAIAMLDRLVRVKRIDPTRAEALLGTLAAVPIDTERGYLGALAPWLQNQLARTLGGGPDLDGALFEALAGAREWQPPSRVSWEGQPHLFDLVTSETKRLGRIRTAPSGFSIDSALDLYRLTKVAADSATSSDKQPAISARSLLERVDVDLAKSLLCFAYAADWSSRGGAAKLQDVARRHDFGFGWMARHRRTRQAWALPRLVSEPGVPWHIEGAALGLDIALAPLALHRINPEALATAPTMSSTERETFVTSLALMNAFSLEDSARDAIADAVDRGLRRVSALDPAGPEFSAVVRETAMDGWRARALGWTVTHDSQRAASLFSMTDLLHLGGGGDLNLKPWGMSALNVTGCLCLAMPPPGLWTMLVGRPQLGLLASTVADLNLHVAVTLRELELPAALAKAVLASAVQEYVDQVRPSNPDDWLTLVRGAQDISRARIEDYVAAATFNGPLVLQTVSPGGR